MFKQLKFMSFAAALAISGPAAAQTANAVMESVGATDVSAMLAEFSISSELQNGAPGQSPTLVATTPGGAKFLVGFFNCTQPANSSGCSQAMISTAQSSAGVAFDDLNTFNGQSNVTTAVYDSSNQILIFGRNVFMSGGVGRDNFKAQVYLFLADMQDFMNSRRNTAKSVAMMLTPESKSKISSFTGGDAPSPMTTRIGLSQGASLEIDMAIANSVDVDFIDGAKPE
ncbi:MAG: YbjN domain-containing protein [Parvularculaceae bacterium]|nr:YbjN domain-containing protein [Parvularculaceae bacterium]